MTEQNLYYKNLLSRLKENIQSSKEEVFLVAPFIKHKVLAQLVAKLAPGIKLTVYTRWRLDEILSGVSDIVIWDLIRERENSFLKLSPNLHAKYYRFDEFILLGSANLTEKALGQSPSSNLELLQVSRVTDQFKLFENSLTNGSILVDNQLYKQVKRIVDQYDKKENSYKGDDLGIDYTVGEIHKQKLIEREHWIPKSRNPENLFIYYSGKEGLVTEVQKQHARQDLAYFSIPKGLDKKEFNNTISFQLLQMPIVQQIDAFLTQPRRFGEMRNLLKTLDPKIDSSRAWQTLMRWLTYFFPNKYLSSVANYSEIFSKI